VSDPLKILRAIKMNRKINMAKMKTNNQTLSTNKGRLRRGQVEDGTTAQAIGLEN
jgi:hypothetical protein